jgi:ubiquinone/menaquinone biosynthesis C-methylase UbiE
VTAQSSPETPPLDLGADDVFRCPDDDQSLVASGGALRCPGCFAVYRDRGDGILDFARKSGYYWGEIPREKMKAVLEYARTHGYDAAIDDFLGKQVDAAYRQSLREPTRIDWRLLLGMTSNDSVLDVGSGWGRLTFALAPWVRHVYSLEYIPERVEFQRIMRDQRGDSNVSLIKSSFLDLPFRASSLNWVLFNGVFEWIGVAGDGDPGEMQTSVLKRSFDILRPGGCVVIAIENRWGINTFFGATDHSGLPFTNLMPRRLASWWVDKRAARLRNDTVSSGYRTYTYGLPGYESLMKKAGADRVWAYAVLPHYNIPRAVIPLQPAVPSHVENYAIDESWQRASALASMARMMLHFAARVGWMRLVYPHYLIVGRKDC